MRDCMEDFEQLIRSNCRLLWVNTYEEEQFLADLFEMINTKFKAETVRNSSVYVWSMANGIYKMKNKAEKKEAPKPLKAEQLFSTIYAKDFEETTPGQQNKEFNYWIILGIHDLVDKAPVKRALRDIAEFKSDTNNFIIALSPSTCIPTECEKAFEVFDYALPGKKEIESITRKAMVMISRYISQGKAEYSIPTKEEFDDVVKLSAGLTENEINRAFSKSLIRHKKLSLQAISDEKIETVKKTGALNYIIPQSALDDIGGLQSFKEWTSELMESSTPEAAAYGVSVPRGYMAFGPPGTSKTASAEVIASMFGVPLLVLSMGKIMSKLVGESERKINQACEIAQACAPVVLLIDEAEKELGGAKSSNQSDSGTTNRVLTRILNFLEKSKDVFVIMTSNDVSQLPPELTRPGRLDTSWYFGMPTESERRDIFGIHFRRSNKIVSDQLIKHASSLSDNFTGAEIKEAVKIVIRKAFLRSRADNNMEITENDIASAIREVVPVYRSSQEKIIALEMYAKGRARFANETIISDISLDKVHSELANMRLHI